MPDFNDLLDVVKTVQRRCVRNAFLKGYASWAAKVLGTLLLAAALLPALAWPMLMAGIALLAGVPFCAFAAMRRAPSAEQAAILADRAAGLKDRLSTAIHFSQTGPPSGIVLRQRADAVAHASGLDARRLFPMLLPARAAASALALLLLVTALFAYRLRFDPPLLVLFKKAAQTRLAKAIATPILEALRPENKVEAAADMPSKGDHQPSLDARTQEGAGSPGSSSEGRQAVSEQKARAENATARSQQREKQDEEGESEGREQADGQAGGNDGNSPGPPPGQQGRQSASGNQQSQTRAGRSPQVQGAENRGQSLTQSVMQAVKNLFGRPEDTRSSAAQGQSGQGQGQQQQQQAQSGASRPGEGSPQAGQDGRNQNGSQQAQQNQQGQEGNKPGSGVGQQAGANQQTSNDFLGSTMRPEQVEIPMQPFTGQAQVQARTGQGIVQTPARNGATPAAASSSGTEQESVPLRYRLYVQRYFDHAKQGPK